MLEERECWPLAGVLDQNDVNIRFLYPDSVCRSLYFSLFKSLSTFSMCSISIHRFIGHFWKEIPVHYFSSIWPRQWLITVCAIKRDNRFSLSTCGRDEEKKINIRSPQSICGETTSGWISTILGTMPTVHSLVADRWRGLNFHRGQILQCIVEKNVLAVIENMRSCKASESAL